MRSALAVALVALGGAAVALAQSKELAPIKGSAKSGTTASAGASPAKELDTSKEGQLGDLVFRAPLIPGGTDALPAPICINGVCKDPICRYRAKDATATSWPAWGFGETLTKVEVGADTVDEDLPHLGRGEKGRKFNGADYYESATTGACQVGTEDAVWEFVVRSPVSTTNDMTATTRVGAATGWHLFWGGVWQLYICHGATCGGVTGISAAQAGALAHIVCGVDRSYASATYGMRCYVNGANTNNADASARSADATSANKFTLGDYAGGGAPAKTGVVYAALYKQSDWLPGTAANATILDALAADRSARFWGTRESVGQYAPTFAAAGPRCAWTAAGKLDCYSTTAPILGATIPPGMTGAGTPSGGGYLSAPAGTQALLYSREFLTGWTLTGTTPVAASGVTSPFVDARATYAITDNDGAGEEYISQTLDITALNTGDDIALCPIAAVASSTQLYTVSVTEQTGGSCTTTTTHYKPTATTTWQQQAQAHDVLDGDCTQAVITVRPYDVASGGAATGSVSVLMNAYLGRNYCQPYYVESTSAAVASGEDKLTYDVTAILGTAAQKRLGGAMRFDLSRMGETWAGSFWNLLTESGNCPSIYYPNAPADQLNYYWNSGVVVTLSGAAVAPPGAWVEHDAHTGRSCAAGTRDCGLMLARPGYRQETSMVACASVGGTLYVGGRASQFLPFGTQIRNVEIYR